MLTKKVGEHNFKKLSNYLLKKKNIFIAKIIRKDKKASNNNKN